MAKYFLFSVDLEDIRLRMKDGEKYKERVPAMIEKYLHFLQKHHAKATFFVVGDMAEKYPSLIKSIAEEGHEIGCHSYRHVTIDKQTPDEFREDVLKNLEAFNQAGISMDKVAGYRAPVFSLTENTSWAYRILASLGFKYSSSVLPADNPLFGWKTFGENIKVVDGISEIPMSISSFMSRSVPFGGGTYFRMLPTFVIRRAFRNHYKKNNAVLGYFHPYDIDEGQERLMHPGINDSKVFNFLMYYNRASVFGKLEDILSKGVKIIPYIDYLKLEISK